VFAALQRLEREIADFSKDHDKRVKAATAKLKAAKQVRTIQLSQLHCMAGRSRRQQQLAAAGWHNRVGSAV
jgi:hypothetical protein